MRSAIGVPAMRAAAAGAACLFAAALAPSGGVQATPTAPRPIDRPAAAQGIVVNDSGVDVDEPTLNRLFRARIAAPRGLSGLMLVRADCGPDPEAMLDTALVEYGAAQRAGEIYNDTLAWLICRKGAIAVFTYAVDNPLARYLDPPSVEQAMAAALGAGGPAAAAAAGLDAVVAQLDRAPPGVDARPSPQPSPTPPPLDDENGDRSSAGALVLALVAAAALAGVSVRRRRSSPAADDTPSEPDAVRELEASLVQVTQRLVPHSPILDRTIHALEPLGDATRLVLLRRHQAMVHRAEALTREAEVVSHLRAARELPERGEEALRRVEDLLVEARALVAYTRQLEREAQRAGRLHDGAAQLIEEAEQSVLSARESYAALRTRAADTVAEARQLPSADAAFAVADAWLATAREREAAGAPLDAGCRADDVIDVAVRITRVARRLRRVEGAVGAARRRYEELQAHAPEGWRDVVGNGAEAEASLDAAASALDAALTAPTAALGVDPIAGLAAGLALATHELARARQLVSAIDARARHLARARRPSSNGSPVLRWPWPRRRRCPAPRPPPFGRPSPPPPMRSSRPPPRRPRPHPTGRPRWSGSPPPSARWPRPPRAAWPPRRWPTPASGPRPSPGRWPSAPSTEPSATWKRIAVTAHRPSRAGWRRPARFFARRSVSANGGAIRSASPTPIWRPRGRRRRPSRSSRPTSARPSSAGSAGCRGPAAWSRPRRSPGFGAAIRSPADWARGICCGPADRSSDPVHGARCRRAHMAGPPAGSGRARAVHDADDCPGVVRALYTVLSTTTGAADRRLADGTDSGRR
ncbi:MAG: hypothetical protein U0470_11160 [Anaerolineae bacterium]